MSSVQTLHEAINLQAESGEYWTGGINGSIGCVETQAEELCEYWNNAISTHVATKKDCARRCYENPDCLAWSYYSVITYYNCFLFNTTGCSWAGKEDWVWGTPECGQEGSDDFIWIGDNSTVQHDNWGPGFPELGIHYTIFILSSVKLTERSLKVTI